MDIGWEYAKGLAQVTLTQPTAKDITAYARCSTTEAVLEMAVQHSKGFALGSDAATMQCRLAYLQEIADRPKAKVLKGHPPVFEWVSLDTMPELGRKDRAAYWSGVATLLHGLAVDHRGPEAPTGGGCEEAERQGAVRSEKRVI